MAGNGATNTKYLGSLTHIFFNESFGLSLSPYQPSSLIGVQIGSNSRKKRYRLFQMTKESTIVLGMCPSSDEG